LRENIRYTLDARAAAGLAKYYELAEKHDVVDAARAPVFY